MKKLLRKIRLIRWLDDWTETWVGETICYGIIALFFLLWVIYKTSPP